MAQFLEQEPLKILLLKIAAVSSHQLKKILNLANLFILAFGIEVVGIFDGLS